MVDFLDLHSQPEGRAPYGIYVRQIVAGGVAAADGRLERGDQLLAIGQSSLVGCDQSEAAVTILSRLSDVVPLLVAKRAAQARGILSLINGAASNELAPHLRIAAGRTQQNQQASMPGPNMTGSTPCLSRVPVGVDNADSGDDDDDDADDSDEDVGPQFGSRQQLTAVAKRSNADPSNRPQQVRFSVAEFGIFTI